MRMRMPPPANEPTPIPVGGETFDAHYFQHCCGLPYGYDAHWTAFFGRIADAVVRDIAPRRVLDAGCAMGILVAALQERGIDAWGVDLSPYAIEHCSNLVRSRCRVGSIDEPFGARYDLICCIEVVEHMPSARADRAIANLCAHTDDVLFSSSPDDFKEPTHINVRPPEYWARLFAQHGFYRDPDFSADCVSPWAVRFRRSSDPFPSLVGAYERRASVLGRENAELRRALLETQGRVVAADLRNVDLETTLRGEIEILRSRLREREPLAARAEAAEAEARAARETIEHMQRSLFWRLRRWLGRT